MEINVIKCGAVGNGITNDTAAIQAAIDACNANGGGTVKIDEGTYLIGGIMLKSNVTLLLNGNLVASGDINTYFTRAGDFERKGNNRHLTSLIYAINAENIEINGNGSIDGNFLQFVETTNETQSELKTFSYPRPEILYMENIKNLHIYNIKITHSPFWTIHLVGCKYVKIDNITIINDLKMPNTDGIDIDRSSFVDIANCKIVTADDAICLKCTEETDKYGDCHEIHVNNCQLTSRSAAIKFGTSSFGNFYNCYIENIEIIDSNRGLAFQLRDSCTARNIVFDNIDIETRRFSNNWWGFAEPIYITFVPREEAEIEGLIKDVTFQNVTIKAENGIILYANKAGQIKNILFNDISFHLVANPGFGEYDLRPCHCSSVACEHNLPIFNFNGTEIKYSNVIIDDDGKIFK